MQNNTSIYAELTSIDLTKLSSDLRKIIEISQKIQELSTQSIVFSKPIIDLVNTGIIFPNTINVIQGRKGVHKSRLTELFCSCLLNRDPSLDYLGFKANPLRTYSVIHIDTERNQKDQYPYSIQQIKLKAGFEKEDTPINFRFTSLIDINRENRLSAVRDYIELYRKVFDTHIIIILDVVTDCIKNFNDPQESLELIDMLNQMINQLNVTFLCVIHENPSSTEKARGHLGTEIINKASQVIHVGFESKDLIEVRFLHSRNTKKPDTMYLTYCNQSKGLVIADSKQIDEALKESRSKANPIMIIQKLEVIFNGIETISSKELIPFLCKEFDSAPNTIKKRLKEIIIDRMPIINKHNIECVLSEYSKSGCATLYSLELKENTIEQK